MDSRLWALLERSLRIDVRERWGHVLRLLAVGVGYFGLCRVHSISTMLGAPGLHFLGALLWFDLLLIAIASIGYFSAAITEEKEEGVLGLMLMTGLSPLAILLGKSSSRLIQAGLLIVLQIPFALLAITLGGVSLGQIASAFVHLLCVLFAGANVALLCSVVCRRSRASAAAMFVVIVVYSVLSLIVYEIASWALKTAPNTSFARSWQAASDSFVYVRVERILLTGYAGSALNWAEGVHLALGVLSFGLAWALFGWATRRADHDAPVRGWCGVELQLLQWCGGGRPSAAPLFWKDFYFHVGGGSWILAKLGAYLLFLAVVWGYWLWWRTPAGPTPTWEATYFSIAFLGLLLAWEALLTASRLFSCEMREQTWPLLCLLPCGLPRLAYGKVATGCVTLFPVLSLLVLLHLVLPDGRRALSDYLREPLHFAVWALFLAGAHVAGLASLYVRWGAVGLGFLASIGPLMLAASFAHGLRGDEFGPAATLLSAALVVCAVCHVAIGRRLQELAAR